MDRFSRKLSHQKGNKIAIIDSPPHASEGEDGDMKLETSGVGAILYVKGKGRWFKFRPSDFSLDGHHGSMKKIRILPSDFQNGLLVGSGDLILSGTYGYIGLGNSSDANGLAATVVIPIGFKATHIKIYGIESSGGSGDNPPVNVREGLFSALGSGALLATGVMNTESALAAGYQGHDDSFLSIYLTGVYGSSHEGGHAIKGGYVKITPILTPERVAEGMTNDDALDRSRE